MYIKRMLKPPTLTKTPRITRGVASTAGPLERQRNIGEVAMAVSHLQNDRERESYEQRLEILKDIHDDDRFNQVLNEIWRDLGPQTPQNVTDSQHERFLELGEKSPSRNKSSPRPPTGRKVARSLDSATDVEEEPSRFTIPKAGAEMFRHDKEPKRELHERWKEMLASSKERAEEDRVKQAVHYLAYKVRQDSSSMYGPTDSAVWGIDKDDHHNNPWYVIRAICTEQVTGCLTESWDELDRLMVSAPSGWNDSWNVHQKRNFVLCHPTLWQVWCDLAAMRLLDIRYLTVDKVYSKASRNAYNISKIPAYRIIFRILDDAGCRTVQPKRTRWDNVLPGVIR